MNRGFLSVGILRGMRKSRREEEGMDETKEEKYRG